MLRNFNDLCGSCVSMFLYGVAATLGYKAGLCVWGKIENKLAK